MSSRKGSLALAIGIMSLAFVSGSPAMAAGPSMDGTQGLIRVHSADAMEPGFISGSIFGLYARERFTAAQSPRNRPETVNFGGGLISLGYAPTPFIELAVRGTMDTQRVGSGSLESTSSTSISNLGFQIKSLLTPADQTQWMLGAELGVGASAGSEDAMVGSWDSDGVDLLGRLNLTYDHHTPQGESAMRVHANVGFLNRTGEFNETAWMTSAAGGTPSRSVLHGDQFLYGLGVEVPVKEQWSVFTEWTGEYDIDSGAEFSDNPMRITPGFRWSTLSNAFMWTLGTEIAVSSDESGPGWQFVTGLSFGGYTGNVTGNIFGVVRDAHSGEPIQNVQVTVRNSDELPATSDATGQFKTKIPEGYAVLELAADGYDSKTRVVEIKGHERAELEFTMMPRNVYGAIQGRVRDGRTGQPVAAAQVRVMGSEQWFEVDPATGAYSIPEVTEGRVELEFSADRYENSVVTTHVAAGETSSQDASLHRDRLMAGLLSGRVQDKASVAQSRQRSRPAVARPSRPPWIRPRVSSNSNSSRAPTVSRSRAPATWPRSSRSTSVKRRWFTTSSCRTCRRR